MCVTSCPGWHCDTLVSFSTLTLRHTRFGWFWFSKDTHREWLLIGGLLHSSWTRLHHIPVPSQWSWSGPHHSTTLNGRHLRTIPTLKEPVTFMLRTSQNICGRGRKNSHRKPQLILVDLKVLMRTLRCSGDPDKLMLENTTVTQTKHNITKRLWWKLSI